MSLGTVNLTYGENSLAHLQIQESLEQCRELRNKEGIAWSLLMLALLFLIENNLSKVRPLLEESLALFDETSNKQGRARALMLMGELLSKQEKYVEARSFLEESLKLLRSFCQSRRIQEDVSFTRTCRIKASTPTEPFYFSLSCRINGA